MLLLAGAFERDRHQFLAPDPRLDQAPHRRLARRVEMADRIEADDALRTQRAVEQIGGGFRRRSRLRRLVPAEMPRHQLIGLQHAGAFGDRHLAGVEGKLQRPLRGLAALPQMLLLGQHVVLDVADGQRAVAPQQPHHLAGVLGLDGGEPAVALAPVLPHRRDEEAKILRRHIGQRMGPVFEHALVDALGLPQVGAGDRRGCGYRECDGGSARSRGWCRSAHSRDGPPPRRPPAAPRRTARCVSSRWARSQIRRASVLVRGRGSVARGIARQCSRIRRVGSPGFRGSPARGAAHLTASAGPRRCRLRSRPRRRPGRAGAHGICRRCR